MSFRYVIIVVIAVLVGCVNEAERDTHNQNTVSKGAVHKTNKDLKTIEKEAIAFVKEKYGLSEVAVSSGFIEKFRNDNSILISQRNGTDDDSHSNSIWVNFEQYQQLNTLKIGQNTLVVHPKSEQIHI